MQNVVTYLNSSIDFNSFLKTFYNDIENFIITR